MSAVLIVRSGNLRSDDLVPEIHSTLHLRLWNLNANQKHKNEGSAPVGRLLFPKIYKFEQGKSESHSLVLIEFRFSR